MQPEVKTVRIDKIVFQQTLENKLADLPPLPAVVMRIMQTINDPGTSTEELGRLVALDQGLSSKILRIVNSAYYGFPKRISTITHAVVILGFNTVRNLVLGILAFGMMKSKEAGAGANRSRLWEHSVAVAVSASLLARGLHSHKKSLVEEAFVAGLLHDIGKLFLDCYFPAQYAMAMGEAKRDNELQFEAEQNLLGIDHAMIGKRIAEYWNYPPMLIEAIGCHHSPDKDSDSFEIAALINAADWLAWEAGHGSVNDAVKPELTDEVAEWLHYTEERRQLLMEEWERQFAAAQDMLHMD